MGELLFVCQVSIWGGRYWEAFKVVVEWSVDKGVGGWVVAKGKWVRGAGKRD